MQGDGLIHDRTGTAFTIGVMGGAGGGSLIGTGVLLLHPVSIPAPWLLIVAGVALILASTVLAGWYMPTAAEIARQWNDREQVTEVST